MVERGLTSSRRLLLRAAIGGVSATLLPRLARAQNQAQDSDKMTKAQAAYQDTPNGMYSCGLCTLFVDPNGCKVVDGDISKDGWCKAFAMAD